MTWWLAKWTMPSGDPAFSELWAPTAARAEAIASRYRFNRPKPLRRPVPEFRPSRLAELPCGLARADVLHSLCYLSTLAARADLAKPEELVGDGSPLHELAHYLGVGPYVRAGRMRPIVLERIAWLEHLLPGMPPDDLVLAPAKAIPDTGRLIERGRR